MKKITKIYKTTDRNNWLRTVKALEKNSNQWVVMDTMPWGGDYKPLTLAAVSYDEHGINVYMRCYESNIRYEGRNRNDLVCCDSCMEFFFSPVEGKMSYLNFEINPIGVLYTGFSATGLRADSGPVSPELSKEYFGVNAMNLQEADEYNQSATEDSFWDVSYSVPYEYIRKYLPEFSIENCHSMGANFYKCGDMTEHVHYLSWNDIDTPKPDYHRPEFFGILEL